MSMQLSRRHLSNQQRSQRSEKSAAELIGGRRQPASGAVRVLGLKGDVKSEKYLLEDKVTRQKSYAIASAYWQKHANYAWRTGKRPLLRIAFDSGPVLVCMDEQTFRELNEKHVA